MVEYPIPQNQPYELQETDEQRTHDTQKPKRRKAKTQTQDRETKETNETYDSARAALVSSLHEAAHLSLAKKLSKTTLFTYARAIRAMEATTGGKVQQNEVESAFAVWWQIAENGGHLPNGADYYVYLSKFAYGFSKAHTPLGVNPIEVASKCAENEAPVEGLGPLLGKLAKACEILQSLSKHSDFFISVRDAAKIIGTQDKYEAASMLFELERRGYLTVVENGVG